MALPQAPDADAKLEKAFNTIPLFMQSLPEDDDNDAIAALQSLAYEGTPDEIAQNFKEQGNEYYKGRRWREALGFYTQGVDAKPTDPALQEALLCNRAACNIELKNYGSVLRDCSKAITLNPKASKAYYRSGLALFALDRQDEVLDVCDRCLAFDSENVSVRTLREKAVAKLEVKAAKERERQEQKRKEQEEQRLLKAAFAERNLIEMPNPEGSANPYAPHFDPEDPSKSTLIIPVFFLYPQYAISDVIPEFVEDTPYSLHISGMFPPQVPPPEWDKKSEYVDGQLVIYAMTRRKRLLKVGNKKTLKDVCIAAKAKEGEPKDGLELKDGCLTFVVLPKGDVEKKWIEEFKKERGW
ncbi:TPR-like protein [Dentipellis sp. KUC8613]|nr:TPR-like protein [Dentipellis sp. KUC8613]